jgi:hypothetical protein
MPDSLAVPVCNATFSTHQPEVKGVSQTSPTYGGLAVVMVLLCLLFAVAWLAVVASSMYRASVRSQRKGQAVPPVAGKAGVTSGGTAVALVVLSAVAVLARPPFALLWHSRLWPSWAWPPARVGVTGLPVLERRCRVAGSVALSAPVLPVAPGKIGSRTPYVGLRLA